MRKLLFLILPAMMCLACTHQSQRLTIGVSQCSDDIWREKQNAELRMGAYFQDNVDLRFASAYDSDERQVQQIDSLLSEGIDLLIVAPNQVQTISPAIDRAYDSGIPVIVFERKTNSRKYTAFISADNYDMGLQMGLYMAARLQGKGRVLEVMGLKGSSPAIERHKGFCDALARYPGIQLVATLQGDWTEQSAYEAVSSRMDELGNIDFVFGQNDRMAMGARRAMMESGRQQAALPRFCGIDGLPGEGGGIQLVRDSILDASYIYPTHGDQLLQVAVDILRGNPYQKEVMLKSAIVTRDNASVLLMQGEEMKQQGDYLDQLHQMADGYLRQLDTQRTITFMAFGIIALLIIAIVLFYLYHVGQMTLRKERVVSTLWSMSPEDLPHAVQQQADSEPAAQQQTDGESAQQQASESAQQGQPAADADETEAPAAASLFIARFREAVEARLEDSELSVEELAADMHLSRVQLYRKVKAITGSTPVELLRTARLKRGYQLLMSTDKSVSEVAYQVGFTAPSYFTKCFKEEFGQLPGNMR